VSGHALARLCAGQGGIRRVAVTGCGQPDDVRRALDAGFDLHLIKPVRFDERESAFGAAMPLRSTPFVLIATAMSLRLAAVIAIYFVAVKWNGCHADGLIWQLHHNFDASRYRIL
jgi:CheY-like chemotaxis protein